MIAEIWYFQLCSRLRADCRNTYHLDTKTCFSLFKSFDFFRSGWLSCNGAFLFKGELATFKTPSLLFPVTITSVTMCCGAHRSRARGISFLPCPYFYSALRASFDEKPLPFGQRVRRLRKNGLQFIANFNMGDDMAY